MINLQKGSEKRFVCSKCLNVVYMKYSRDDQCYFPRNKFLNFALQDEDLKKEGISAEHIWCATRNPGEEAPFFDSPSGKIYKDKYLKPRSWPMNAYNSGDTVW